MMKNFILTIRGRLWTTPHYAMDAQRVGRAVLKEDVSKIIFGGKSASSVR